MLIISHILCVIQLPQQQQPINKFQNNNNSLQTRLVEVVYPYVQMKEFVRKINKDSDSRIK